MLYGPRTNIAKRLASEVWLLLRAIFNSLLFAGSNSDKSF